MSPATTGGLLLSDQRARQPTGRVDDNDGINGDGQRVGIVDSQGTKKPIWDGENILLETDGSDVTQVVYTLEPAGYGNLVSQRRGSTTSTYLFDALGSTRKLTDSAGAVTDSYDFRAYGETYASSGTTVNVFRWVGELGYYYDVDRQAYYLRARPYSPALARFLSQDPIGFEGSPWNLYEYTGESPVNGPDSSGLVAPWRVAACLAAVAAAYKKCLDDANKRLDKCLKGAETCGPTLGRQRAKDCMTIFYLDVTECAAQEVALGLCCAGPLCNPFRNPMAC